MTTIPLAPAPGSEEHAALALVDSRVSLPGGHVADELDTPQAATQWLRSRQLVSPDTTLLAYCQNELAALRATLRELFDACIGDRSPAPESVSALNAALTAAPAAATLGFDAHDGFHLIREHPVTRQVEFAMARIAEDMVGLLTEHPREQIARCDSAPCDRFYLRTHARRHWCSTRCGDRVRAARAYARKQGRPVDEGARP